MYRSHHVAHDLFGPIPDTASSGISMFLSRIADLGHSSFTEIRGGGRGAREVVQRCTANGLGCVLSNAKEVESLNVADTADVVYR